MKASGSLSQPVKSVALLMSKMNEYKYDSRISGEFDNENQVWVEKFTSGDSKELYIFFKPFKYVASKSISFDNETVNYTITLDKQPKSIKLTLIDGTTQNLSISKDIKLESINSLKFLEVGY